MPASLGDYKALLMDKGILYKCIPDFLFQMLIAPLRIIFFIKIRKQEELVVDSQIACHPDNLR